MTLHETPGGLVALYCAAFFGAVCAAVSAAWALAWAVRWAVCTAQRGPGRHRLSAHPSLPDTAELALMAEGGALANAYCEAEERERFHLLEADGTLRCWTCDTVKEEK